MMFEFVNPKESNAGQVLFFWIIYSGKEEEKLSLFVEEEEKGAGGG